MKNLQEPTLESFFASIPNVDTDNNSIFIFGTINDDLAKEIWTKMHLLDDPRSKEPIRVYINSEGGDVDSMYSIIGCLDNTQTEVHTYITGIAYSAAAFIALAGNKIFMSKYATMMFHCYSATMVDEKIKDMANFTKNSKESHERMIKELLKKRKLKHQQFMKNYESEDWFVTPQQALEMKIIDGIY